MTFEQLDYFIETVRHDTFFEAAESLHISQSSLSKQIIKLEKELDVKLFDRSKRSAQLTDAGHFFYKSSLSLLAQYHQVMSQMKLYQENIQHRLHIGTLPILNQYQLTSKFREFTQLHPELILSLDEVEEQELLEGLTAGKYDVIIARKSLANSKLHRTWQIAQDELVLVVPSTHPFAGRKSISLAECGQETFLLMNPYTSVHQLCLQLFHKNNINPHVLRTGRVESIISSIAVGEGIGLLAAKNFQTFQSENISTVPLTPTVHLPITCIKEKAEAITPALQQFISYLCSHLEPGAF